jgi:hypothetical protein
MQRVWVDKNCPLNLPLPLNLMLLQAETISIAHFAWLLPSTGRFPEDKR